MPDPLDRDALMEACLGLARASFIGSDPAEPNEIDPEEVDRACKAYFSEAEAKARTIADVEGDPNAVTRVLRYLASEHALLTDDVEWFKVALSVLVDLTSPVAACASKEATPFMADLARAARHHMREAEAEAEIDEEREHMRAVCRFIRKCKSLKVWARLDHPKDLVWPEVFDPVFSDQTRPRPELESQEGWLPLGRALEFDEKGLKIHFQVGMTGIGSILGGEKRRVLEVRLRFSREAPPP